MTRSSPRQVFGTAGYIAHVRGLKVSELDLAGPGLVFLVHLIATSIRRCRHVISSLLVHSQVYPTALTEMSMSNLFSILFFFMLFLLAVDTQFALTETVVTSVCESKWFPQRWHLASKNKWMVSE